MSSGIKKRLVRQSSHASADSENILVDFFQVPESVDMRSKHNDVLLKDPIQSDGFDLL